MPQGAPHTLVSRLALISGSSALLLSLLSQGIVVTHRDWYCAGDNITHRLVFTKTNCSSARTGPVSASVYMQGTPSLMFPYLMSLFSLVFVNLLERHA